MYRSASTHFHNSCVQPVTAMLLCCVSVCVWGLCLWTRTGRTHGRDAVKSVSHIAHALSVAVSFLPSGHPSLWKRGFMV